MKSTITTMASHPIAAVALLGLLSATPSQANHIDTCSHACAVDCNAVSETEDNCQNAIGGTCIIEEDITCASTDAGIGLYQGTDLVFESGKKLLCPTNNCGTAIKMKGTDSTVTTEDPATALGGTSGGFGWTIDCAGWDDSTVDRVRITGGLNGVSNCETVTNNIIEGADRFYLTVNHGIYWDRKVNSGSGADVARYNLIRDKVWSFTVTGSTPKVNLLDNNIMTSNQSARVFMRQSGGGWNLVQNNNIHGSGDIGRTQYLYGINPVIFSGTSTGATDTNLCSVDDHPGCNDCISAGRCFNYVPE